MCSWTSLAAGKFKHAELFARRHICRRHFKAAPQLDRLNLASLQFEHDAAPRSGGSTILSVTDGCLYWSGDEGRMEL
jgi:hypothetical protein